MLIKEALGLKKKNKKLTKLKNKETKQIIEWPMPVRMDT